MVNVWLCVMASVMCDGGIIMIMNIISVFTVAATAIVVGKIIVDEVKLHIVCQQVIKKNNIKYNEERK